MPCYVYVIELLDTVGARRKENLPNILVGDTCKSVEQRFEEHRTGERYPGDRKWARHVAHLLPDLYEHLNPLATRDEAVDAAEHLALELEQGGFTVRGRRGPMRIEAY